MNELAGHYLDEVRRQFRGHKRMVEGAIAQVSDEEFFRALDAEANSIAVIMKHLGGNLRSRFSDFLNTDGEKADRRRDEEFVMDRHSSREQVMEGWEKGWAVLSEALASLTPEDIQKKVSIRAQPHTVLQALNRQVAHYAYHAGQIVFLAKHFRGTEWKSLSIARGRSDEFNAEMEKKFRQQD
ncbi:MAG TPA: DUF1572 family protein [Terriglobales bacterium]|jgi:hypothetical protein|nr:DUF1572 family protein [Terriglobales bacterium]